MATIIKVNGAKAHVAPKNGTDFKLDELSEVVGGYIEILWSANREQMMVLNEEGKLLNLELNVEATRVAREEFKTLGHGDCIVGNVLVCNSNEVL